MVLRVASRLARATAASVVVAAAARAAAVRGNDSAPPCDLSGNWTFVGPDAFDHLSVPAWTNQLCIYEFTPTGAGGAGSPAYQFTSPLGCYSDPWKDAPATITVLSSDDKGGGVAKGNSNDNTSMTVAFAFDLSGHVLRKTAWVGARCNFVDVEDNGLYIRTSSQLFSLPPHEWMRTAATWIVRAAHITFADGTRHLTPGYPTEYVRACVRALL